MNDLISRTRAQEEFLKYTGSESFEPHEACELLDTIPSVELPVSGEWLECQTNNGYYECSICGKLRNKFYDGKTKFCPNCGADMRK